VSDGLGAKQLNLHGPGVDAIPVAKVPVPPGGSDLCFEWPGEIEDARAHLMRHGVETEMGPVERRGARGVRQGRWDEFVFPRPRRVFARVHIVLQHLKPVEIGDP